MSIRKSHEVDDVFGISREVPFNYVHRSVDDFFARSISKDKHIILFGCSKQGKSSLVKRHLQPGQYIAINCDKKRSLNDIYSAILKEADFEIETESEKSSKKGSKIGISLKALSFVGLSGAKNSEQSSRLKKKKLEFDIDDVHDVINALKAVHFSKYIIIEDFHYLDEEIQLAFSYQLKIFNDRSRFLFIIIGVWLHEDLLSQFNGDLAGRLCNINVDAWTKNDLEKMIKNGEDLLNIVISDGTKELMIDSAFGSIAILQELCLEFCIQNGIKATQKETLQIGRDIHVAKILNKWINNQNAKFNFFLRKIITNDIDDQKIYKLIVLCLLVIDPKILIEGLDLKDMMALIKQFDLPQEPTNRELERALLKSKSMQLDHGIIPVLFEYDEQKRKLFITDRFFFIWLANKNKFESMAEIEIEESLIRKYSMIRY